MHLSAFLLKVISYAIRDRELHVNIYELNVRGNTGANVPEFLRYIYISKLVNFPVREFK
jgi:hypothetical protein